MRCLACCLALAALLAASLAAEKVPWTSLYATWSFGGVLSWLTKSAFFELPLTAAAARDQGWVQARAEEFVTLWCMKGDPRVCTLYDLQGSIAGLQVSFPTEDMAAAPYDWTKHPLIAADNIFGQDVAGGRYYFVEQEVLQGGGRASFEEIGSGLWLREGDGLRRVPQDATQLEALGWTRESCIPTMGRHYYMNVTSDMDCQKMEPYFLITDNHKDWTHGIGFQSFGKKSKKIRQWLESVPALAVKPTLPNAPQCLVDWASDYSVLSVHVYFRGTPYLIMC